MTYNDTEQAKQRATLLHALKENKYCDVTFIIGINEHKKSFQANRLFLSLISPVFKAMLYGEMQESKQNAEIEINDIHPDAFEAVLNYAYCNDPKLSPSNIIGVYVIADKYQISSLLHICSKFVASNLNNDNFCTLCLKALKSNIFNPQMKQIMQTYFEINTEHCLNKNTFCVFTDAIVRLKISDFMQLCQRYLRTKDANTIGDIINSDGFTLIDLQTMRLILQTQPLNCEEELLWNSVVKWARHQSDNDNGIYLLKSIRDLIRFGRMKSKFFTTDVTPLNILTQQELISILMYFANPDKGCGSFNVKSRNDDHEVYLNIMYPDITGGIDKINVIHKSYSKQYTLRQVVEDIEGKTKCEKVEVHMWLQLKYIHMMYPINTTKVGLVTTENVQLEDMERWVEVPWDYIQTDLGSLNAQSIPVVIEKKANNIWPMAKGDDWRETLKIGDIIDARDSENHWYESMVRLVYPENSNNAGKCVIHYIGWLPKWDEIFNVDDTERLAKRHAHTNGPYIGRYQSV
eukprot:277665_1